MSSALRTCFSADGRLCTAALASFVPRLHALARVLEVEPRWQLVSSSLLFVFQADDGEEESAASEADTLSSSQAGGASPAPHASMRVIDFAHAYPLHCARDAGYLYGLANLIRLLEGLLHDETTNTSPAQQRGPKVAKSAPRASQQGRDGLRLDAAAPPPLLAEHEEASGAGIVTELPVDLTLVEGDVGYSLGVDGTSPPEAIAAASNTDQLRLHPDEFLEAFAHSPLGKWGTPWLGFRANLPPQQPLLGGGQSSEEDTTNDAHSANANDEYRHLQ